MKLHVTNLCFEGCCNIASSLRCVVHVQHCPLTARRCSVFDFSVRSLHVLCVSVGFLWVLQFALPSKTYMLGLNSRVSDHGTDLELEVVPGHCS